MPVKSIRKIVIICLCIVIMIIAGRAFLIGLHQKEPIVKGPGVTKVAKLSDYFKDLVGTPGDTEVYIIEGEEEGGTALIMAGVHPNEISGVLTTVIFIENAKVTKGRIMLIPFANNSAFTTGHPGEAYPMRYSIKTEWGNRWFRFGDRWTNPLHQWPDPEVYTHYPSGQSLSGFDIRNLNRCFPGNPKGSLTEKLGFSIAQLIREEKVDLIIDLHEAEPMYPVINTIVANQRAMDIAVLAAMNLSAFEGIKIGNEISPENLHGLSHRELGDYTEVLALEIETCNPIQDPLRGRTDETLLLTGKDDFILKAGKFGLLFVPYDEHGSPIDERVGRDTSSVSEMISMFSELYPEKKIEFENIPRFAEVIEKGVGHYLSKPEDE